MAEHLSLAKALQICCAVERATVSVLNSVQLRALLYLRPLDRPMNGPSSY